ncbi:MAG: hypothetical protein ACHQUC_02400 [Chlamydiales bacterium]
MKILYYSVFFCILASALISATEFTISSYNCGALSNHYDYLRAAAMQKIMQERHIAEPENMALNEKIQNLALKILFSPDLQEQMVAQQEWERKGYQQTFEYLTSNPANNNSPNTLWNQKVNRTITSYQIRPVQIYDDEVHQMLNSHLGDLSKNSGVDMSKLLLETRTIMAERTFLHHLKYDIICLQEADYLDASMFPKNYQVLFSETSHSKNGVAWNKDRFELVERIGNVLGKAFVIQLLDKETGKRILVASGHITGCNPFRVEKNASTGLNDSAKGDGEIQAIIDLFQKINADIKLIGMDSNVTSLHPRLNILKDAGYRMDSENYLEPTCTNPYQVLNTRIDWIVIKADTNSVLITNIPVLNVGLNNIQTNFSDHKPIAAKIEY